MGRPCMWMWGWGKTTASTRRTPVSLTLPAPQREVVVIRQVRVSRWKMYSSSGEMAVCEGGRGMWGCGDVGSVSQPINQLPTKESKIDQPRLSPL